MRISTSTAFESSLANLQRRQQALSETQAQLTSGKRVQRPSDDPGATAQAERALASISRLGAEQRALQVSRDAMQLGESALADAGDLMQRAREIVVGAGNATYTDAERATLADTLRGIRNDLLTVANRHDGAGRFLFGGQGSDIPPFVDAPGGVVFRGLSGAQPSVAGETTPLSIDGRAAWMQATDPTAAGTSVSPFSALDQAIAELSTAGRSRVQVASTVSDALLRIDAATGNLSTARARTGEALNRVDGIETRLGQAKLDAERDRSNAEDLDMVSAISDFQNRQSGYDAALKTYSMVQRMSLFDYLK